MVEILIHCGTYKTGSSSIQNAAWCARKSLLETGWLYPQAGLASADPDVGMRHANLVYAWERRDAWDTLVASLLGEIEETRCQHVLLSAEAWSRPGAWAALEGLIERLRGIGTVHGLVYLRNAYDYARSLYREFTRRRGNTLPFDRYLQANAGAIDLLQVARGLHRTFAGRLQCVPYAPAMDVRADFFRRIGVELSAQAREPWTNTGEDAVTTEAMRVLNHDAGFSRRDFPDLATLFAGSAGMPDVTHYAESVPDGVLARDAAWREEFAQLCGWTAAEVDALCLPTAQHSIPVAQLTPVIQQRCAEWLATPRRSRHGSWYRLDLLRQPGVMLADVDRLDRAANGRITIGGVVLLDPAAEEGRWRLVARDEAGEHTVRWGIASPHYQREFPQNRFAMHARFRVARLAARPDATVEILLCDDAGTRVTLFEVHAEAARACETLPTVREAQ